MRIRSKTLRGWLRANFTDADLQDIVTHGCQAGFPGLTYYGDTTSLYHKFKTEIWSVLAEAAKEYGYENVFTLLSYADRNGSVCDDVTMENIAVWTAVEIIANELVSA